ncbi:MAG TPA: HAMP domain-containing sensor histidine kinase [Steroidobacteraceae bacterium]|jgi:two-component system sensor histidine kinase GlrK|nr:HAMP domain-containing sensor histidine kinase [Steroidobacteraceae bacterium]
MRWARPKSLTGLMLLGLALIAGPLLVAVVDAAIQIRSLTLTSQQMVLNGVRVARLSQSLFADIRQLDRTVKLYQVLGDVKLLEAYRNTDQSLAATRTELAALLDSDETRRSLDEFAAMHNEIASAVGATPPGSPAINSILARIERLNDLANDIVDSGNKQNDARLAEMQRQTSSTQKRLFWQSALLVPLTLIAILALTLSIGRPLRAIDRAISELGRGTFSRSIEVSGPRDLERLGAQLEWLRLRLLDLAQERNRFLRHMSHELKTPLANIREGAELLMDGAVGPLDNSQREVVAILRDNGIKLHRLIENLLSFSAWQKESVGLDISEFRLRPLVKQVLEAQQLTVVSQRVRLEVKVDDLTLKADRGKMRLIIENLLSNAIKYSPKGGTVYLQAVKQDTQLVIDVADAGAGIPQEERARVFEAFYTGRPPAGVQVKGTGIGLSVVLEFVNAHGGTIEIVDGEFPGAHFRIRMPLLSATNPVRTQAHAA